MMPLAAGLSIAVILAVFYLYLLGKLDEVSQRGAFWTGLAATIVFIASFSFLRFSEEWAGPVLLILGLAAMIVACICAGIIWRHDF